MSMSHPFIVTAVLAVLLSSSIVSAGKNPLQKASYYYKEIYSKVKYDQILETCLLALSPEYKWNGSDWIWTDDSKDDGGSVQDTGGGRSGQNSRKFDGAGRNVSDLRTEERTK